MAITANGNGRFNNALNTNSVYQSGSTSILYNMIIDMTVLTDNFKGSDLYSKAVREAGLYGDKSVFIASQPQAVETWEGHEAESAKLLATNYNKDITTEQVVITEKFMSSTTTDQYESKKAFLDEGGFSGFVALMKGFVADAQRIHKALTYNAYCGTVEKTSQGVYEIEVDLNQAGKSSGEAIGEAVANLISAMDDYTDQYNSLGYLRRYAPEDIKIVFNNNYRNGVRYVDLPSVFHNDRLEKVFEGFDSLNARFFGDVNANATEGDDATVRSLVEQDNTVTGGTTVKHYKPGDLINDDYVAPAGTSYTVDGDIIAKVFVKLPIYLTGWTAATEFTNARGLTNTNFLIWTESKPYALDAYPVITIKAKASN